MGITTCKMRIYPARGVRKGSKNKSSWAEQSGASKPAASANLVFLLSMGKANMAIVREPLIHHGKIQDLNGNRLTIYFSQVGMYVELGHAQWLGQILICLLYPPLVTTIQLLS